MTELIFRSKIHWNQSINCFSIEEKKVGIEILKNPKVFIGYSQTIDDIYENLEDYNPTKEKRVLIEFDYMIADIESNKKLGSIVTEWFLRIRELNILFVFISEFYCKVPKTIRLDSTHCLITKITNKRELQLIASNNFSGINFKDFMKLYKSYAKEPYSFSVNNTTLSSDNILQFARNLL